MDNNVVIHAKIFVFLTLMVFKQSRMFLSQFLRVIILLLLVKTEAEINTLVKHFNGLLKPTRGKVLCVWRRDTNKKVSYLSRKVGYVFQNPDDTCYSVPVLIEEIAYGPRMLGMDPEEVKKKVEKNFIIELGCE
jgi:ABC-type proline/glycine betaine transport system ATPase subunit